MTDKKQFVATAEAKAKAGQFRMFAAISWLIAIAVEVFAILKLISNETLVWLIVAVVAMLIFAVVGNLLWKRANRLNPASEKDKVRFFVQNQLGAIISVIAFLPLVLVVFFNKDIDGKTKGIAGGIAAVALLIAGATGIDFNPASIEKYTEQINAQSSEVMRLTGEDHVFWTPSGNKLHLYEDCQHIRSSEVSDGTVEDAWHARNIDNNEVCKTCANRAEKNLEQGAVNQDNVLDKISDYFDDAEELED